MSETAPDGTLVTDRGMRDMDDCVAQQRRVSGDFRRPQELSMAHQRPDAENITAERYSSQLDEFADIDD